jgi:hypothetical protein
VKKERNEKEEARGGEKRIEKKRKRWKLNQNDRMLR